MVCFAPDEMPVLRIFELYSAGDMTFEKLTEQLAAEGYIYRSSQPQFSRTTLSYILNNRMYIGEIVWHGKVYHGKFQPLVSRNLFEECQAILQGKNRRLATPNHYLAGGLGELIDLISTITLVESDGKIAKGKDILGRVYEYFLGKFAAAEGKAGGEFYTPACVVKLLVEMIEPYKGRIFDPCCGSGGMFVQSEKFVLTHGGRIGDIAIYGQESNPTTRKLALMNLAIRGIDANLGQLHADSFHNDQHKGLKADFILANPPFNMSDWGGERLREDARWKYGTPPAGNANYAWIQHFIHHLSPTGIAGFVLWPTAPCPPTSPAKGTSPALRRNDNLATRGGQIASRRPFPQTTPRQPANGGTDRGGTGKRAGGAPPARAAETQTSPPEAQGQGGGRWRVKDGPKSSWQTLLTM